MNIIQHGGISSLTSATSINSHLPIGVYDIQFNGRTGEFELHHRPAFKMPEKVYGGVDDFAHRCLKTFGALDKGMASLLSGPKGCGKTLTAKQIALLSGMPVLCVIAPYAGPQFTAFLTDLPSKCVIFIDEFEKLYNDTDTRNSMLTLLDGASDNKHLFILTSNDANIGEFFSNRPGRVRYHKKYGELDPEVIKEMIHDMMPEGHLRDAVEALVLEQGSISPDALVSIISECLIHNEVPNDFLSYFNINTDLGGAYDAAIVVKGFKPKLGLSEEQFEKAKHFCSEQKRHGTAFAMEYYAEKAAFCEEREEVWSSTYCYPFGRDEDGDRIRTNGGKIDGCVTYARSSESEQSRHFDWKDHQIASCHKEKGEIFITLLDGTHFKFSKAKPFSRLP